MTFREPGDPMPKSLRNAGSALNRAQFLTATAIGLAAAGFHGAALADASTQPLSYSFPFFPQVTGTYMPETVGDILNVLVTGERWPIAILTAQLSKPIPADVSALDLGITQAALAQSVYHVDFLESLGAQSLSDTFTTLGPPAFHPDVPRLKGAELLTTILTAAYMAAGREFAELGQPLLSKSAFQNLLEEPVC